MITNNSFLRVAILLLLFFTQFEINGAILLENLLSNTADAQRLQTFRANSDFDTGNIQKTQTVAKGIIQAKNIIENLPEFRIYFEGKVATSDDNGLYTFPVDNADISKYRIVVTRRLQHIINKKNTLDNFRLIPDKDYTCYTFKKLGRYGGWVKTRKSLNHKQFILPKNSIVILINPKYIDKIEEWDIGVSQNIIKLPKIVLKSDISEKELKRIAAKSLLCFDDAIFHEKVGRQGPALEAKTTNIKITLP